MQHPLRLVLSDAANKVYNLLFFGSSASLFRCIWYEQFVERGEHFLLDILVIHSQGFRLFGKLNEYALQA